MVFKISIHWLTDTYSNMIYQVQINGMQGGGMKTIDLCTEEEEMKSMTVLQLKEKLIEKLPGDPGDVIRLSFSGGRCSQALDKEHIGVETIRLVFASKQLEDPKPLSSYGIQHLSVIQLVLRVRGG